VLLQYAKFRDEFPNFGPAPCTIAQTLSAASAWSVGASNPLRLLFTSTLQRIKAAVHPQCGAVARPYTVT